jgi:hypothetical protein
MTLDIEKLRREYPHAIDHEGVFHIDWMDNTKKRTEEFNKDLSDAFRAASLDRLGFRD